MKNVVGLSECVILENRKVLWKKPLLLKICCFFLSFLILCFVFTAPRARAAEFGNDFLRHLISGLHLEVTQWTGQTEQTGAIKQDNIDNVFFKVLSSTPHVWVPLNDHLKLFFNIHSTLKDIYEKYNNNDKKCATLGIDIFF